jgi:hypothetical protein
LRILFVGLPDSIHTARWIGQVAGMDWDLHLFPAYEARPHSELAGLTLHTFRRGRRPTAWPDIRLAGPYPFRRTSYRAERFALRFFPRRMERAQRLAAVVRTVRPDVVHSLDMQRAAYLTFDAREALRNVFPPWFVSCGGNEINLFGRLAAHAPRVRAVLEACDYFTADCERDIRLARQYGFRGKTFPALPGSGALDIELVRRIRPADPPSARRVITLKGCQNWAGRALVGLRAVELCADVLDGYRMVVYFADEDVAVAAELMSQRTGIPVELFPHSSYEDSLRMHGRARVSVGVSISDGLPLSTMESALMGAFPVQTNTSCAGEWLRDGETILLVPPDEPDTIAAAIRRALTDDALVDRAALTNFDYIAEHLNQEKVGAQLVAMYEKILADGRRAGG